MSSNSSNGSIKVLSLVFVSKNQLTGKLEYRTKLGSFSNASLRNVSPRKYPQIARNCYNLCLVKEKEQIVGYCIDAGHFDSLNVPISEIKAIKPE